MPEPATAHAWPASDFSSDAHMGERLRGRSERSEHQPLGRAQTPGREAAGAGARHAAFRIRLDPSELARNGVSTEQLERALADVLQLRPESVKLSSQGRGISPGFRTRNMI